MDGQLGQVPPLIQTSEVEGSSCFSKNMATSAHPHRKGDEKREILSDKELGRPEASTGVSTSLTGNGLNVRGFLLWCK